MGINTRPQQNKPTCFINDQPCLPEQLSLRTMNFGQAWRTPGITEVTYRLSVPLPAVNPILERELAAFIDDAQQYPDEENHLEQILTENGWPAAHLILKDSTLLLAALNEFGHEILLALFGDRPSQAGETFVLNTISAIYLKNGQVCFTGTARRAVGPVQYQDD